MKRASVSEAKNGLSGLLDEVRSGETVLITHHGKPVARIEAYSAAELTAHEAAAELVRLGIADPPRAPLDVECFLSTDVPGLAEGLSASRLVVTEREEAGDILGFFGPGFSVRRGTGKREQASAASAEPQRDYVVGKQSRVRVSAESPPPRGRHQRCRAGPVA